MTFNENDHPRVADGSFTHKTQSGPDVSLKASTVSVADELFELILASGYYSEDAARSVAEQRLAEVVGAGGDPIAYLEYRRVIASRRRDYIPSFEALTECGRTAAELGELLDMHEGAYSTSAERIFRSGLGPDRIAELADAGVPKKPNFMTAFHATDRAAAAEWMTALRGNLDLRTWVNTPEKLGLILDSELAINRAIDFSTAGIDPVSVAKHPTDLSPSEAQAFATESGLTPELTGAYMVHNIECADQAGRLISADTARQFGPSFAPAETSELLAREVAPKTARSLRAASKQLAPEQLSRVAEVGIATGKEFREWRSLVEPRVRSQVGSGHGADNNRFSSNNPDEIGRILAAKASGTTPARAAEYQRAGLDDPSDWASLHAADIDIPEWSAEIRGSARANRRLGLSAHDGTRERSIVDAIVAFKSAGGTARELGNVQRAGINTMEAHRFVGSQNLWEAGAPYRDVIIANEMEQRGRNTTPVDPWPWTEGSFRA